VNFELCRDHATHLSPPLGLRLWVGLVLLGYEVIALPVASRTNQTLL
jgi:hypothetical protein